MQERIYLSPPWLTGKEHEFVQSAFLQNWVAPAGPDLSAFESEIARCTGVKYAVALSSCTAAIHLGLVYLGATNGDDVICSSFTFAGSSNPIHYVGARPVFIDSEAKSYGMSPAALEKALYTLRKEGRVPKAAIVVNLYGQIADMDALLPIFNEFGIPVIEDAAESLGAKYDGKKSGSFGTAGVISFNGNKIVTTSGGGALVTNCREMAEKIRFLSTQAREKVSFYEHKEIGFNYRLSNISAAIGRGQIETLDERINRRRKHYMAYAQGFKGLPLQMMPISEKSEPNYWLSCAVLDKGCGIHPQDIIDMLERKNIESRRYWKPMHMQPVHRNSLYFQAAEQDVCKDLFERGICLPSGSGMTDSQRMYIIRQIRGLF